MPALPLNDRPRAAKRSRSAWGAMRGGSWGEAGWARAWLSGSGASGSDWFFANLSGGVTDEVGGLGGGERLDELD